MLDNSTRKPRSRKVADRPKKPYSNFPLCPHASGAWQKKIRGKVHYFGKWARRVNGKLERIPGDGWEEALTIYKAQADDLHAGRTPRVQGDGLTVGYLCNHFLTAMLQRLETGRKMSRRMFEEYKTTTDRLIAKFGVKRLVDDLAPDDFTALATDLAKRYGPVRLGNEVQKVFTIFKHAITNNLTQKVIPYGSEFKKPDKTELRRHRAKNGEKMFEADELRRLIDAATVPLKAMILLGINSALGNHDCALLPLTALDLDAGWLNFPRPKTGIPRRCPLWPETVAALHQAIAARPEPRQEEAAGLVFLTTRGRPWLVNEIANPVSVASRDLMKTLGIHHKGIGFYTLRHTFRTVADAARDHVATDLIMGHSDSSMGGHYRERVDDIRLVAVAAHVRQWLYGATPDDGADGTENDSAVPIDPPQRSTSSDRPTLKLFAG